MLRATLACEIPKPDGRGLVLSRRWQLSVFRGQSEDLVARSEEHTSELQSPCNLVCRLLLEKKREIDIVITRAHVLTGNWEALYDEVRQFRDACGGAHMKASLATVELGTLTNIDGATVLSM